MKGLCILGATGSIGVSTLDVVARHPERYRVVALTGHRRIEDLYRQCLRHRPAYAVVGEEGDAAALQQRLGEAGLDTQVLHGQEGLTTVATLPEVDYVMAAIVGAAGLLPTLAAARAGKRILLANKEALVVSGPVFMEAVREADAELLPIDSEHNAIFQCMPAGYRAGHPPAAVRRILLTASGGPFLDTPLERLPHVTPEQAVAHPKWDMGKKISVDSATMMNKGLEVIEACLLFDLPPERIQVVIHPQSVVHSLVDYDDGSVLAELGNPDMRIPIAYGMAWPERIDSGVEPLDLFDVARLDFREPDFDRFPCLKLAFEAARAGGTAPALLNAANEVAVAAFLERRIPFTAIAEVIAATLDAIPASTAADLDSVLAADAEARRHAESLVAR
ncbi:1-deoxy-D-xylulose-5-phosphate reductoisomerase [Methylomarinovum caldicuralii]|uniref:1-deoxy-D-xylulose 5-phosphate reductoisomerase n=1 Tax=Methylomarinovum caldicuralii TaxID=438856 RepID=A0AAU9BY20_9GAMM|nr:1-deoxy-D-xylulose-5-phosphate reductoisomerase [Methylomarinovum caldicuralii]BCX80942.1 1-deoxy-D-xylulose-5-phosphate reductoisomerase [Methylomarinovum caldicuralii]